MSYVPLIIFFLSAIVLCVELYVSFRYFIKMEDLKKRGKKYFHIERKYNLHIKILWISLFVAFASIIFIIMI